MAWALKSHTSGNCPDASSSSNVVLTLATNTTPAVDLLWVGVACYQNGGYPTISDNHSSAGWVTGKRGEDAMGNRHIIPFYLFNPAADGSFAVTITTAGGNFLACGALGFSGSSGVFGAQVPAADGKLGTVSGKNCDVADLAGVTTTENDMLLIAGIGSDGTFNKAFDPSGGSTWADTGTNVCPEHIDASSGNHVGFACSYRLVGATTGQFGVRFNEPNFVVFDGGGINIMSFKMASAAVASIPNQEVIVRQAVNRASTY